MMYRILMCLLLLVATSASAEPLRIMPLGDSITVGYTDAPTWTQPFNFGYRAGLYSLLSKAGVDFKFVGDSAEPFQGPLDPTNGGTKALNFDLRELGQNGHRGYAGWEIGHVYVNVVSWILQDKPDVILLTIGTNGINANSPWALYSLVSAILATDPGVRLIVAQITPLGVFNQDIFNYDYYIKSALVPYFAAEGFNIRSVDFYTPFLRDPANPYSIEPSKLADGIHPTNAMYDVMAERWFKAIVN